MAHTRMYRFNLWIGFGSALYLTAPNIIFLIGWYRWYIGLLVALLCLLVLFKICRFYQTTPAETAPTWTFISMVAMMSLFISIVGGMGELTYQHTDYVKHNVIFHNLITKSWPVSSSINPFDRSFLCYYLAYYLPPALLAKVLGLKFAAFFTLLWGWLGVFLSLIWVSRILNQYSIIIIIIVLSINGLDPLLTFVMNKGASLNQVTSQDGFGYPVLFSYQSAIRLIAWNPQHFLPAWITTGLVLELRKQYKIADWGIIVFIVAQSFLWSPFVTIGMAPILLSLYERDIFRASHINVSLIAGLGLMCLVGAYYLAHTPIDDKGFLWELDNPKHILLQYLIFIVAEIGIVAILVVMVNRRLSILNSFQYKLFMICLAFLLVIPVYRLGMFNDFLMRVSLPALGIFAMYTGLIVYHSMRVLKPANILLLVCLLVGVVVPLRQLITPIWMPNMVAPNKIISSDYSIKDLDKLHNGWKVSFQYTGNADSFYSRYLAKTTRVQN